ncbi:16831_t:CDS:2, partial [Gigaspora rosea]
MAERDEKDAHEEASYDKTLERRIVRKCDFYLLPILTVVYLLGVIDRTNVGNAVIAGFDYKFLNTTPELYNFAIAIYFISYMIFEIPASFVTKILGFQVWLPIIMICWAVAAMAQAALAEAGFPPSVISYVGSFYARKELTLRYSYFMSLITLSGAIGGIASYFIVQIKGTSLHGYQWLFILESIPTIITAIIVALFMTRGPGDARFLTPEERKFAVDRLRPEGGPAEIDRNTAKTQIKLAFTDLQVYVYLTMLLLAFIPFNTLAFFLPTLVKQLGYTSVQAQLMVVPTLLAATVWMVFNSWASDRYQTRALNLMISHTMSTIGLIGMIATDAKNPSLYPLRYFFTVILACGAYSVLPVIFSWFSCNILGQYKRNVSIAIILTMTNTGALIGVQIFPATDAPAFIKGNVICLSTVFAQRLREIAMKLVEGEPRFDEVLCDRHPNW